AYPVAFGAWLGHEPSLYAELAEDPIYQRTVVNTILYVGIAVNLKMFAALLVGQSSVAGLRAAVGDAGPAGVHLDPLDAQRPVGPSQQLPVARVRHRRPGLARHLALARARLGDPVTYLEVDAVLDGDPAGRADGDPAGPLRGGRGRRRDRPHPVHARHLPAARQPLPGVHAALDDLHPG